MYKKGKISIKSYSTYSVFYLETYGLPQGRWASIPFWTFERLFLKKIFFSFYFFIEV